MSYYSMDWTNEKVLQLISEYKARTELWDRNDVNYKNRVRKLKAWEDIASVLELSRFEVERKFRILLVQYRREKARILKLTSNGDRRTKSDCSSWYAFRAFDFWNDRYKMGKTSGEYDNDTMSGGNSCGSRDEGGALSCRAPTARERATEAQRRYLARKRQKRADRLQQKRDWVARTRRKAPSSTEALPSNNEKCNFNDAEYAEVKIEPTSVEFESCYLEDDVKDDYIDEVTETTTPSPKFASDDAALRVPKIQNDAEPNPKRRKSTNSETATDEIDLFMAYVAAEIRNLKSAEVKRKLKRRILRALLEAGDEDDGVKQ